MKYKPWKQMFDNELRKTGFNVLEIKKIKQVVSKEMTQKVPYDDLQYIGGMPDVHYTTGFNACIDQTNRRFGLAE